MVETWPKIKTSVLVVCGAPLDRGSGGAAVACSKLVMAQE